MRKWAEVINDKAIGADGLAITEIVACFDVSDLGLCVSRDGNLGRGVVFESDNCGSY